MAVKNNQGYRRDLNLEETPNELAAFDSLAGVGAASDIRLLQNNLRNTSKVGFNTVDAQGFFSFASDRQVGISSLVSEEGDGGSSGGGSVITVTLTDPYEIKKGNLVELKNISGVSSAQSLNSQYTVQTVSTDLRRVTLIKDSLLYSQAGIGITGVQFIIKPQDIFTFTNGDIIGLSTNVDFVPQTGINTTSLSRDNVYYVTQSNAVNRFKLATKSATVGLTTIILSSSDSVSNDNFTFIRDDSVHQQQLINYIEPDYQDTGNIGDDFSFLDGSDINPSFDTAKGNSETAEYFANKKFRGDKPISVSDEVKFEGNVVLNDPANVMTTQGVNDQYAPGIFIGNTRAFSSDNNPWNKVGTALTTSAEEVSIGELAFFDGSILSDSEEGSMIIAGISSDVSTPTPALSADSSLSGGNFTHKLPIKVQDENGNQESYYLLLSNT